MTPRKAVSCKVPVDLYEDYRAAAEHYGVPVTDVLLWALTELRPLLLRRLRRAKLALQRAQEAA